MGKRTCYSVKQFHKRTDWIIYISLFKGFTSEEYKFIPAKSLLKTFETVFQYQANLPHHTAVLAENTRNMELETRARGSALPSPRSVTGNLTMILSVAVVIKTAWVITPLER